MGQFPSRTRLLHRLCAVPLLLLALPAAAQVFVVGMRTATDDAVTEFHPTHLPLPDEGLTERGRHELLQNLVAEQGFAHRGLPMGAGLRLMANGGLTPKDDAYRKLLYEKGISAEPGARVMITAVSFSGDNIVLDLNGGPYARHRFLSHIQINDSNIVAPQEKATGSRVTLAFEGGIPELTAAEVKALLAPVIDFSAHSSEEAYANTLPLVIRQAIAEHRVLVGMNRRMVLASLGAPQHKNREHISNDPSSEVLEEWIYGEPPKPIRFVRFRGEQVVRLEIAELGKPVQVQDTNHLGADTPQNTRVISNGDVAPGSAGALQANTAPPPTLHQPGDTVERAPTLGRVQLPADGTTHPAH